MQQKQKTVLVVDDDQGTRDTLTAILRRDFRVLRASSGEAALALMEEEDVDLMLLDIRLPGINGFEVLKIVRENYPLCEVIVISAITELETAVTAMKCGAYHYVSKEFDYDAVRSLIVNAGERQDLVFGPTYIEGDLFALNRVYRNVIINACQATAPGGDVVVRTRRQEGHAIVEIADTGCGIPLERLKTMFDDFVTTKRRGLGLAISNKFVEQLGGSISVASKLGRGTTFTLRFPLTKERPAQLAAV
jgi:two-component system response regulator (stage 0 sporulation protein F)